MEVGQQTILSLDLFTEILSKAQGLNLNAANATDKFGQVSLLDQMKDVILFENSNNQVNSEIDFD
ncbi:hypothetical protein [Providencia alcalifaciens]|uniref:hypothetical protein n=1 Tax=Providencia alcalifaciens TaxID=126385 RepID=UPI003D26CCF9